MNQKELNKLIEEHYRKNFETTVKKMARKCGGWHNAEDVVQEAYVRCLKYWDSYKEMEGKGFDEWFNTILFNVSRSELKKLRNPFTVLDEAENIAAPNNMNVLAEDIKRKIKERPERERVILSLFFLREYKSKDIAKLVKETHSAIRKIISRFKADMREEFSVA